ncbi:MAG: hypothetical protein IJW92_04405 [Clostridia bacterium]|nr:hypothetical protein [Clostridia bacterium]
MKTSMKLFVLLMALLLVIPCLAACGNDGGNDDSTTTSGDDETTTTDEGGGDQTTTKEDDRGVEIEQVDLQGYTYRAYVRSKNVPNASFYCEDFWVETQGTTPLQIAVYDRNAAIEADYNCSIVQIDATGEQTQELTQLWTKEDFALLILRDEDAATLTTKGMLADIMSQDNINLDGEWYDQGTVEQLSIGDKLYFFSGDMNISTLDNAVVTLFNEDLYAKQIPGGEDLYQLVRDGKWTVSKMVEIAKLATVDGLEDGNINPSGTDGDILGYFRYASADVYYFYSCGGRITTMDEDGYPVLTIGDSHSLAVIDLLLNTITDDALPAGSLQGSGRNGYFKSGNLLFTDMITWDVRKQMYSGITEWKYGILPTPMFEETGTTTGYKSIVQAGFNQTVHFWSLPSWCKDLDTASFMLEVMAQYSHKEGSTMDAYFESTISLAAAKDGNSREMLRIVRDSLVYDIGLFYSEEWGGWLSALNKITTSSSTDNPVTALFGTGNANLDKAQMAIEETIDLFKNPSVAN